MLPLLDCPHGHGQKHCAFSQCNYDVILWETQKFSNNSKYSGMTVKPLPKKKERHLVNSSTNLSYQSFIWVVRYLLCPKASQVLVANFVLNETLSPAFTLGCALLFGILCQECPYTPLHLLKFYVYFKAQFKNLFPTTPRLPVDLVFLLHFLSSPSLIRMYSIVKCLSISSNYSLRTTICL